MPGPLIAVALIAAIAGEAVQIASNHGESHDEAAARGKLGDDASAAWSGDRSIITDEYSRLRSGFEGSFAEKVLTGKMEAFGTMSHQDIWEALNGKGTAAGVSAAEINAGADGWRRLVTGTTTAVDSFRTKVEAAINGGWDGTSGSAAVEGVRTYATESAKLPTTFQMVANGIDLMEGALGQVKTAIPEPEEVSWIDEAFGHVPGNGVVKGAQHRANEAEASAQEVMTTVYQPNATHTDEQTPVLAVPKSTVGDSAPNVPGNSNPGAGSPVASAPGSGSPATTPQSTTPEQTSPAGTNPTDDTDTDDDSDSEDTSSAATTPATTQTTPSTTDTPSTNPSTPGSGTPGSGSPAGLGTPGAGRAGTGSPSGRPGVGKSVPGTPGTGQPSGTRGTASVGAGGAHGMSGMPGRMGGGGRGTGKDDENTHETPDYLVTDRETELIGLLPPVLPPGGVIGGD